jgi:hypothetical protein
MQMQMWRVEIYFHAFLTSALDGSGWSASRLGRFITEDLRDKHYP